MRNRPCRGAHPIRRGRNSSTDRRPFSAAACAKSPADFLRDSVNQFWLSSALAGGWGNIVVVPTAERLRHGAVEQLGRQIADSAGAIGRPFRAVDTLAAMERRGTITAGMRQAGEQLRNLFRVAHLDPLHAASLVRVSTATGGDDPSNRVLAAKERLWRAICAVGGLASPGGACLWHVIGLEQTLKEWALTTGSSRGRPVAQETASGILVGALGVLETHFGVRIE